MRGVRACVCVQQVQASIGANTYVISGMAENKKLQVRASQNEMRECVCVCACVRACVLGGGGGGVRVSSGMVEKMKLQVGESEMCACVCACACVRVRACACVCASSGVAEKKKLQVCMRGEGISIIRRSPHTHARTHKQDLLPGIINQLGPDNLENLKKIAEQYQVCVMDVWMCVVWVWVGGCVGG